MILSCYTVVKSSWVVYMFKPTWSLTGKIFINKLLRSYKRNINVSMQYCWAHSSQGNTSRRHRPLFRYVLEFDLLLLLLVLHPLRTVGTDYSFSSLLGYSNVLTSYLWLNYVHLARRKKNTVKGEKNKRPLHSSNYVVETAKLWNCHLSFSLALQSFPLQKIEMPSLSEREKGSINSQALLQLNNL